MGSPGLRAVVATLLAGLVCPRAALAQPEHEWVLVASAGAPVPDGWPAAVSFLGGRLRAEGLAVRDLADARRVFERRVSAEPSEVQRSELEELRDRIERAMVLVATGQRRGALREMTDGMELLRRATETINRETAVASNAFDGCLITVRALIELRRRDEARERARECFRLFPDVAPDPREHPPWVIGWLAEVGAELAMEPRGSLRVVAEREGCGVHLQGLRVGTTPFQRDDFTPGEQRIQVECDGGRPGRVHRLVLGAEPTTVNVDTRFDAAVRTSETIELRYGSAAEEARHRLDDGLVIARALDGGDLLLATPDGEAIRIDRVRVGDRALIASVRVRSGPQGPDATQARAAAAALARGESVDATGDAPVAIERWQAAPTAPPRRARRWVWRATPRPPAPVAAADVAQPLSPMRALAGISAAVAGLGLLAGGYYLYGTSEATDGSWDIGTGLAGSGLFTLGVSVTTPTDDGFTPWEWISTGIGAAATGVAILAFSLDGGCERYDGTGRCVARNDATDLGILLLGTAAPFFAVPVVQLVANLTRSSDAPTVTAFVSSDRFVLGLRGEL